MKNEKRPRGFRGLALTLMLLLCFGGLEIKADPSRPEVSLYACDSVGVSLYMIFDLRDRGILCGKSNETEILKIPSVSIPPSTFFDSQGNFSIVISEANNKVTDATTYGSYFFTDVGSGAEKRTIAVFKRRGTGEKAVGCAGGDIWLVDGERKEKIGQMAFLEFISPEGDKRSDVFTRLSSDSPWLINLGDKIFQKDENGLLTQVGWVGWRKISTAAGKQIAILMTKDMKKNSKWAGYYEGKIYRDQ